MKKTLYSLMLNDEVMREVDMLAHSMGTNRSNLVNEILAEYVNYVTPERRINDVLNSIEELMKPSRELRPVIAPNSFSVSLKSSLEYKYRPTIKYEVLLYKTQEEGLGEISVNFRTTSDQLIGAMTGFFRLWKSIEDAHLLPLLHGEKIRYSLSDGKFTRSIAVPLNDCSASELGSALSEYIRLFDTLLKSYLSGRLSAHEIEAAYYSWLVNTEIRF